MVLKLRPNITEGHISPFAKFNNGFWTFDSVKFFEKNLPNYKIDKESEKSWNKEFEDVLNGPDLYRCTRCGIPDTKENLDRGVEHSKYECEAASFYFKIYKRLSDDCRENPGKNRKCLEELDEIRSTTRFQEGAFYGRVPYVIRNYDYRWVQEFEIPRYEGFSEVTDEWKNKYLEAMEKLSKPVSKNTLQGIAEGFDLIQKKTKEKLGLK